MVNHPADRPKQALFLLGFVGLTLVWVFGEPCFRRGAKEAAVQDTSNFLIDDFSGRKSALGTEWRLFTDRVMGGVSDGTSGLETIDGRRGLCLRGRVSLKKNGGFIQVALPLYLGERPFNAAGFKGVRIWARGNGKTYHVHLRTGQTRLPWQYFSVAFEADDTWRPFELPFDQFEPENLSAELDIRGLERIAIVAIGEEFEADIAVSRLEFYR
jgi:Complex I intermediate-associated protein 30 (CIA30)